MEINVDKVLQSKNPKLYKKLPKFVIHWLERTIHQDEINHVLSLYQNQSSINFAKSVIDYLNVTINVTQPEIIANAGRSIVVSNHPLGGLDGLAYISFFGQYHQNIKFPVNDILLYLEPMKEIFIPINKHGKNRHDAIQQFNEAFESDALILYFPAGLCSRKTNGVVCDLDWKKTIISKARQYKRDIIPAYFDGINSNHFYNLANFRKKIGIKSNIEMLYLPDELFKQKNAHFNITFGDVIGYESFSYDKNDTEWATWLKEQVYALKTK